MTIRQAGVAAFLGLLVLGAAAPADSAHFEIVPGGRENTVQFESKGTIESFEGKTNRVQGTVEVDPGALGDSLTVRVEVDLSSLDTGIALRNKHMRENHLETGRYPTAVFEGGAVTGISNRSFPPGEKVTFNLSGRFELHGVRRTIIVPVEVTREDANGAVTLRVVTSFPVKLSDYGISRPSFLLDWPTSRWSRSGSPPFPNPESARTNALWGAEASLAISSTSREPRRTRRPLSGSSLRCFSVRGLRWAFFSRGFAP